MLRLNIPATEFFDESTEEFHTTRATAIQLEHSLVSLAKWEAEWEKPFLNSTDKTADESLDYIRCMTITQNVDPGVYDLISRMPNLVQQITDYINRPMTATTIKERPNGGGQRIMTAELLYYDMFALNIPMECQKWHLNRLIMLIRVCAIESNPKKKMGRRDIASYNQALNQARRQKFHTKG